MIKFVVCNLPIPPSTFGGFWLWPSQVWLPLPLLQDNKILKTINLFLIKKISPCEISPIIHTPHKWTNPIEAAVNTIGEESEPWGNEGGGMPIFEHKGGIFLAVGLFCQFPFHSEGKKGKGSELTHSHTLGRPHTQQFYLFSFGRKLVFIKVENAAHTHH